MTPGVAFALGLLTGGIGAAVLAAKATLALVHRGDPDEPFVLPADDPVEPLDVTPLHAPRPLDVP